MAASVKPVAFVALTSDATIAPEILRETVSCWSADQRADAAASMPVSDPSSLGDGTIMTIGAFPMLMLPLPRALNSDKFTDDVAQNHAFPAWREAITRHEAHIIVTPLLDAAASAEETRRATLATLRAASALAALPGAVGVYWGPSGLFHDCLGFAERRPQLRKTNAELMVRLRWYGHAPPRGEGIGVLTQGLIPLVGREVLHPATREPPDTIYGRVLSVCARLIANGPVISDGDARIGLVPDQTRGGQDVLRIDVFPADSWAPV